MTRGTRRSIAARALAAGLFAVGLAVTASSGQEAPPRPVELAGEGSWGPYRQIVSWQDALSAAKAPTDLGYTNTGSTIGRADFVAGMADFAIAGRPLTDEDLSHLPDGSADVIDAPVGVTGMAVLLGVPYPDGLTTITYTCDPNDPNTPDPDACITRTPYTGPVRIPARNLAAALLRYGASDSTGYPVVSWNHPDVLAAMGVPNFTTPPFAGPAPALRSEPSAQTYYLQEFIKTAAPDIWTAVEAANPGVQWEPITERLPRTLGGSRQGVEQQVFTLGLRGTDPATGAISNFTAGAIAPAPASARASVLETFPGADIRFVEVRNAAGEWVAPTTASLSAAIAAGGDSPLYALTHPVPGAYPLAWVDHLYAPAHGLSIEKTEALSAVIRYIATVGQDAAASAGEGRLPPSLVDKAVAAADALVRSNCVGPDRTLATSADVGPYFPAVTTLPAALATTLHCVAAAVPTPPTSETPAAVAPVDVTTEPAPADSSEAGSPAPSDAVTSPPASLRPVRADASAPAPMPAPPSPAVAPGDAVATAPGIQPIVSLSRLPLPSPSVVVGSSDRVATMLVGAAAYLIMRRWVGRRARTRS